MKRKLKTPNCKDLYKSMLLIRYFDKKIEMVVLKLIAKSTGKLLELPGYATILDKRQILAASFSGMVARIPIAHIHGGETTHIVESIRHAITKMSWWHFIMSNMLKESYN